MISNVSALTAMYASYPLYLIRTRQQYQIVPENMFEMMGRIWRYQLKYILDYLNKILFLIGSMVGVVSILVHYRISLKFSRHLQLHI
jgi:hypothetical protein